MKEDKRAEQKRVDFVIEQIKERIEQLEEKLGSINIDVVDIRKKFWEDITVNLDNAEEAAETHASIKQQAELLSERERTHRIAISEVKHLYRLKHSPYFGRIDFTEEGEETESIYIGTASFVDKNGLDFYVYDWRAPISSLYYDYGPGPANYETPSGTIEGEVELKRQFIIKNGVIEHLFNTGITIGDEVLQQVLGEDANAQMKSIVATIQKEQNEIIRNEKSKLVLVQGVAGSGKTSAALQRVAYLLYRYRNTLDANQIVLFSPNPMFNSYISTVLPELGEDNMEQTTFQQYLYHRLGAQFTVEDPFTQMEYILQEQQTEEYKQRIDSIKIKSSQTFMAMIDDYVYALSKHGLLFFDISFRGEALFTKEELSEKFYSLESKLSIPNRLYLLTEWIEKAIRRREIEERKKQWVDEAIELLDKETYLKAYQKLQKSKNNENNPIDNYDREHEILAALVVKKQFKPLRKLVHNFEFLDVAGMYKQLFKQNLKHAELNTIAETTRQHLNDDFLPYEDATPYLYLKEQLEGFQVNTSIRHVFIDEAQDYTPFQFSFIRGLFPRAKLTVLGDRSQTIYSHSSEDGFSLLQQAYHTDETSVYDLKKSYRSTKEIVDFTKQILQVDVVPFNRHGEKPVVIQANNEQERNELVYEQLQHYKRLHMGTIAVICKTAQECEEAFSYLKQKEKAIRLITKSSSEYDKGVLIIPSYLAKGVEFDAVIIFNGSKDRYHDESVRKLFYTACTRAMHALTICYVNEISPFLHDIDKETYISK
ncbi:RNA polymerase recycling motor HelD [Alkalihalobacillus sp. LMS39]|uniref:RNA polymerase recycling motor HelD n=1 Tax=Alkalihalobacillus sp. LMS39 TaxID=2924032 RepID=UPI001FB22394|nr:RNA polymerase recycling motor HelD [Alkalihalobacillus sp. LMS39]UOE96280.1 AAA family ATPase [Alkalihalobacillus sp. LMS39]